jgi:hypothetical protein
LRLLLIVDSEDMLEAFLGDNAIDNLGRIERQRLIGVFERLDF